MFASLRGKYVYDLGNDAGEFISVEGTVFTSRQFELTELDVELFHLNAGPGFKFFSKDAGEILFRPSVRLTHVRLDDEGYLFSSGIGADVGWKVLDDVAVISKGFYEHREYYETKERSNADTQDGKVWKVAVGAAHKVDQTLLIGGQAFVGEAGAFADSEAYSDVGAIINVRKRFESPVKDIEDFEVFAAPWSVTVKAQYKNRKYEGPNPIVSNTTREDDVFQLGATLAVPLGDGWSVFSGLADKDNQSNTPNNNFENIGATLGAKVRF